VALNSNGSVAGPLGTAGCGGIPRNIDGNFTAAFAANNGTCSVVQSELWGILHSLQVAKSRGFWRVCVDSDSAAAINLITEGCSRVHTAHHSSISSSNPSSCATV